MSDQQRLQRARTALDGLSVADAFGGFFEGARQVGIARRVQARELMPAPWRFTDDTNMALSVYAILRQHGGVEQAALARSFAAHFDRRRGYGAGMFFMLPRIRRGEDWRALAAGLFDGTGSFGNGAAMRIAPVGGYFADDLDAVSEQARRAAAVTHTHPEAAAGAIAAAAAGALAWQAAQAGERPDRADFVARVLPHVPESVVREGLVRARDLPPGTRVAQAVAALGNGSRVSCQDTLPFTLWCAGEHLDDYEEAIWLTLSGGGDADTTCAIVGGIVALYVGPAGIPGEWLARREPLPDWAFEGEEG